MKAMQKQAKWMLAALIGWFAVVCIQAQVKSPLEGTWVLESAKSTRTENGKSVDLNLETAKKDSNLGIWDELLFSNGNLRVKVLDMFFSGTVTISADQIEYTGAVVPLIYTWKIEQGNLHITRDYKELSLGNSDIYYSVSLVYHKKN